MRQAYVDDESEQLYKGTAMTWQLTQQYYKLIVAHLARKSPKINQRV
jgi:hypothetical protein